MLKNKLIVLLLGLLIISNGLFTVLLFARKEGAPPVALVFHGKEAAFSSLENAEVSSFWNNYPYLVLASEGKQIDAGLILSNTRDSLLSSISGTLIYRFFPADRYTASDTILKIINKYKQVMVVTDSANYQSLIDYKNLYALSNKTYLLSKKIDLPCDQVKQSYFFILSKENRPLSIYYPRREVPGVTEKYIDYNLGRARFFK